MVLTVTGFKFHFENKVNTKMLQTCWCVKYRYHVFLYDCSCCVLYCRCQYVIVSCVQVVLICIVLYSHYVYFHTEAKVVANIQTIQLKCLHPIYSKALCANAVFPCLQFYNPVKGLCSWNTWLNIKALATVAQKQQHF